MTLPKILIIDDDEDADFLITHWIKKNNLASSVDVTLNGEEGIEYIKSHSPPDYILLDINMPRMNGWEFLEAYKALPDDAKSSTTIIIVSVSENPDDIKRAENEHVKYVKKPLTQEILKEILIPIS